MNPSIPDPVRGKDVLEWAVPVTRALNALHDKTGATVRNERDRRDRPPHPFEVRWAGEEHDGDGAWVIWLPDVDTVLMADGSYVTPTGITAADALPDGWYPIDDLEDEGDVYLNVSISDSATTATFATDVGQSSTGTTVIAVKVACTAADTDDDGVTTHSVTQFVTSAVIIGGNGGSGGTLTASGTVVTGVDYVSSTGDPDYSAHAYSLRVTRGRLTYNAATGALTVVDDPELKQFIATTPLTQEGGSV